MMEKNSSKQRHFAGDGTIFLGAQSIISATIQRREYPYIFAKHIHKSVEIYLIDSGRCAMDINNEKFFFKAGDFVMIFQNTVHSFYLEEKNVCTFRHIHFNPAIFTHWNLTQSEENPLNLMDALLMSRNRHCHLKADSKISFLITDILEDCGSESLVSSAMANLHMAELLLYLIKLSHPDFSMLEEDGVHTPEHIRYVSYALSYIHENYSGKILIPDIASHLNISPRYLSKVFYQHMNLTILNYINIYRINQAIDLMLNTNFTLTNIAAQVGLKDSQHFSKLFKNTIGLPPNQYRKLFLHEMREEASKKDEAKIFQSNK